MTRLDRAKIREKEQARNGNVEEEMLGPRGQFASHFLSGSKLRKENELRASFKGILLSATKAPV